MRGCREMDFSECEMLIQLNQVRGAQLAALSSETRAWVESLQKRLPPVMTMGMETGDAFEAAGVMDSAAPPNDRAAGFCIQE